MYVFSAGATCALVRSSLVAAYSNSNATMTKPVPAENPPLVRDVGVVVTPRKPVRSARAGAAQSSTSAAAKTMEAKGWRTARRNRMLHRTPTSAVRTRSSGLRPPDIIARMDFRPSDEQELLRRTVREFAEAEMRPHVMEWDEA